MIYIKTDWLHDFPDEPKCIYSELDSERYEVRKVEVFPDGTFGTASNEGSVKDTFLSELPIPSLEKIANDEEFNPLEISQNDFEVIWRTATRKETIQGRLLAWVKGFFI